MPNASKPSSVLPGLWISGISAIDAIESLHITHILVSCPALYSTTTTHTSVPNSIPHPFMQSVINGPPPPPLSLPPPTTLHIDIEDQEDANILAHLPKALDFIHSALHQSSSTTKNNVLVMCAQGTSRSATVVTAYLMLSQSLDPDAALSILQRTHPSASPNSGFMQQLHFFHAMQCTLNSQYIPYRRFVAQQAALQYTTTGILDPATLSGTGGIGATDTLQKSVYYRCRTCRTLLATSDNILDTEEEHQGASTGFSWRKQRGGNQGRGGGGGGGGGGIFVQPLKWMADMIGTDVQGKLYCPKCNARMGTFNWSGIQNNTGGWMTPGFHLHMARLDVEDLSKTAALLQSLSLSSSSSNSRVKCKFTHLILDCDGVMVDSERPSCEALYRSILQVTGFSIPHHFPDDYRPVFGMNVQSCIEHYAKIYSNSNAWPTSKEGLEQLAATVAATKEGIYRQLTQEMGISAFPGVKGLVEEARGRGLVVAIASSGSPDKINHNLQASGLQGVVPAPLIVSAKYVERGKPAPDVYIEAMRRAGCFSSSSSSGTSRSAVGAEGDGNKSKCIPYRHVMVVEDAVNGLMAARAAGCFTVAVTTSLPAEDLRPWADVVVHRLEDIDFDKLSSFL